MCTALAVIGGIIVAKTFFRAMRWHRCAHGGCGGFGHMRRMHRFRRWGGAPWARGPMNLGDIGLDDDEFDQRPRRGAGIDVAARVDEVLRGLELNARQAAEAGDVIAVLRGAVGPERYGTATEVLLALRAVGKTPFDIDLADAALGPRLQGVAGAEAREALEHLHTILTEEQRATLLRLVPRPV
jgi:hypothetical protein